MSVPSEPNLRLVKPSNEVVDEARGEAQGVTESSQDASSPTAASARTHRMDAVSGEIRNNWSIPVDAAPGTTLMGVGNFPPRRDITPLGTTVFVSPATVAAIAKAKRDAGALIEIEATAVLSSNQ